MEPSHDLLQFFKSRVVKALSAQNAVAPHVDVKMSALMQIARMLLLGLALSGATASAKDNDPCLQKPTVDDVQFTLSLKDSRTVYKEGEIITLVLSFTSSAKNRYWADVRNYDRSGRLGIEYYCLQPEAPDPLESYFKVGAFLGGGLGSTRELDTKPFTADAELNEWRRPTPGHYKLFVVSYRVWRPPDAIDKTPYGRISEIVRSNTIEFDVKPASRKWQAEQLQTAIQSVQAPPSPEDAHRAARTLRFLNTKDSIKELAKLFWGLNEQQPAGWDLMFGLYGSSYRQLAIDSMRAELVAPDHPISSEFLYTLAGLQINSDPAWDPPRPDPAHPELGQEFWKRRQAHTKELTRAEIQIVLTALPRKVGRARAVTLNGIVSAAGDDPDLVKRLRPALIASWGDLPNDTQSQLIQFRWSLVDSPLMLPVLQAIVDQPPPPARTEIAMTKDAALSHIFSLDPKLGRELIVRDLENPKAEPSVKVINLLPAEDISAAIPAAVDRITRSEARELDFELIDRYADAKMLNAVQTVFEQHLGQWACSPQSAMLRYFLRVAPDYGARQVRASLAARKDTHCYSSLLQELGDQLPNAELIAIDALDDPDPEVVQDTVIALGKWGSPKAEEPLWARLRRFHQEWSGREDQLRMTPDYRSVGSRGVALEQALVMGIAGGPSWICPPEKLSRLLELVWSYQEKQQIEGWIKAWNQSSALINPNWFPEDNRTYSVLQYQALTLNQLLMKIKQFPAGTRLMWQFWQQGQIAPPVSLAMQEAVYEQVRAVAEQNGVSLGRG